MYVHSVNVNRLLSKLDDSPIVLSTTVFVTLKCDYTMWMKNVLSTTPQDSSMARFMEYLCKIENYTIKLEAGQPR